MEDALRPVNILGLVVAWALALCALPAMAQEDAEKEIERYRSIVEIIIPTALLHAFTTGHAIAAPHIHHAWTRVLREIAAKVEADLQRPPPDPRRRFAAERGAGQDRDAR